jgi:hypothetical protein
MASGKKQTARPSDEDKATGLSIECINILRLNQGCTVNN